MAERTVVCNIASRTDVGLVRPNNEDSFITADLITGQDMPLSFQISHPFDDNSLLLAVSDGVGGGQCGEVASKMTVNVIKESLARLPRQISAYDRLVASVEQANNVVWTKRCSNSEWESMAATATAALIDGDHVYIAEVGDSRAYLIRTGKIKQVTTDQSFVAQLVLKGIIQPEQAVFHPRKNVILQAIGSSDIISVAVSMFRLQRGDALLLCTDGLSDVISPEEMIYYSDQFSPQEACERMVEIAKERGGRDNITIVLSRFNGNGLSSPAPPSRLTGVLQTLSTFDPEQKVQKSHLRTNLLGNSFNHSFTDSGKYDIPMRVQTITLAAYPYGDGIKQECQSLVEYIDYCQHLLMLKTSQIQQAVQWLEGQGGRYANLSETLEQIESSLSELGKVRRTVTSLLQAFEDA
jgi:PPM family protein phosphatase